MWALPPSQGERAVALRAYRINPEGSSCRLRCVKSRTAIAFIAVLLTRVKMQRGVHQIFLFGPKGAPLHVARHPIPASETALLEEALALFDALEPERPRPFFADDPQGRFRMAALDDKHDVLVMIMDTSSDTTAAEERARAIRADLARHVGTLRESFALDRR